MVESKGAGNGSVCLESATPEVYPQRGCFNGPAIRIYWFTVVSSGRVTVVAEVRVVKGNSGANTWACLRVIKLESIHGRER